MDEDRLSDEFRNSEMREVQLWENERFSGMSLRAFSLFVFHGRFVLLLMLVVL